MAKKAIGMARNVVGPEASRLKRWSVLLSLALILGAGVAIVIAVHDAGALQLDGDADTDTNTTGAPAADDDWDKVCFASVQKPVAEGGEGLTAAQALARCGTNLALTGGTVVSSGWTSEDVPDSTTIFTVGSKDTLDVTEWVYKNTGGLPNKDNLLHGFAIRYSLPADNAPGGHCPTVGPDGTIFPTCELLYFGSTRFDDEGSATTGVWFLQNQVTLGNTKVGGGFNFNGVHAQGDVLVTSEFTVGGTVSTMKIFAWNPHCTNAKTSDGDPSVPDPTKCAEKNLLELASSTAANCDDVADRDQFCGTINPVNITMPWSFTDQDGDAGANGASPGEFFEGGINLSTLGLGGECFQTALLESRTSAEANATTKDFVLAQLGGCEPTLATDVRLDDGNNTDLANNGIVSPGTPVRDLAIVTIQGASAPDDATGTVDFSLCFSATAFPNCSTGGTPVGTDVPLVDISNPANTEDGVSGAFSTTVNTAANPLAPGFYCFRAEADVTNYPTDPDPHTDLTTECFRVRDTTTSTTAQRWVPNDQATVLKSNNQPASGSVVFTLYPSGNCTGTPIATFGPITLDANGQALTNNVSAFTTSTTISWRVVFTSSDPNVLGSTSHCERSDLTINNDIGS